MYIVLEYMICFKAYVLALFLIGGTSFFANLTRFDLLVAENLTAIKKYFVLNGVYIRFKRNIFCV